MKVPGADLNMTCLACQPGKNVPLEWCGISILSDSSFGGKHFWLQKSQSQN